MSRFFENLKTPSSIILSIEVLYILRGHVKPSFKVAPFPFSIFAEECRYNLKDGKTRNDKGFKLLCLRFKTIVFRILLPFNFLK